MKLFISMYTFYMCSLRSMHDDKHENEAQNEQVKAKYLLANLNS